MRTVTRDALLCASSARTRTYGRVVVSPLGVAEVGGSIPAAGSFFILENSILYPGNNMYDKYFFQQHFFCIFFLYLVFCSFFCCLKMYHIGGEAADDTFIKIFFLTLGTRCTKIFLHKSDFFTQNFFLHFFVFFLHALRMMICT